MLCPSNGDFLATPLILVDEIVPFYGVPECLLSDRGTNLLSHSMWDLCQMLGIKKLNTTAYHPECDGMAERFNRKLKSILRKHAVRFGKQWDRYLSGVLYSYRNTPHDSTGEKPSYLLFGTDLRSPAEAAYLPPSEQTWTTPEDYREGVVMTLSSARSLAAASIEEAHKKYKRHYDRKAKQQRFKTGDQVLVRFPGEQGKQRKLSRPWHGPYRITSRDDPDVSVVKSYFPEEGAIRIHQKIVCHCPPGFPPGYYWYGANRHSEGNLPKWVERLANDADECQKEPNTKKNFTICMTLPCKCLHLTDLEGSQDCSSSTAFHVSVCSLLNAT